MMETGKLIANIETCFPEIRVADYRRIRMGWEPVVLEVNRPIPQNLVADIAFPVSFICFVVWLYLRKKS
jgi:hypothetical protein